MKAFTQSGKSARASPSERAASRSRTSKYPSPTSSNTSLSPLGWGQPGPASARGRHDTQPSASASAFAALASSMRTQGSCAASRQEPSRTLEKASNCSEPSCRVVPAATPLRHWCPAEALPRTPLEPPPNHREPLPRAQRAAHLCWPPQPPSHARRPHRRGIGTALLAVCAPAARLTPLALARRLRSSTSSSAVAPARLQGAVVRECARPSAPSPSGGPSRQRRLLQAMLTCPPL
eukprot:scaffold156539_cov26-Tisochrysis_lutea.AAC.4